jgi:hypothetical protein
MALILIRGENDPKLLNAIADIERHANLSIISEPKVISAAIADDIVERILKVPLRSKSRSATAFFVKEDITLSIMQVKTIHPPAHVIVVSDEYDEYEQLNTILDECPNLKGYHTKKPVNSSNQTINRPNNKFNSNYHNRTRDNGNPNNRQYNNNNRNNRGTDEGHNNQHPAQPTQLRDYRKDYLSNPD